MEKIIRGLFPILGSSIQNTSAVAIIWSNTFHYQEDAFYALVKYLRHGLKIPYSHNSFFYVSSLKKTHFGPTDQLTDLLPDGWMDRHTHSKRKWMDGPIDRLMGEPTQLYL